MVVNKHLDILIENNLIKKMLCGRWLDYVMLALAGVAWVATPVLMVRGLGIDSLMLELATALAGLLAGGALFIAFKFVPFLHRRLQRMFDWQPPPLLVSILIGLILRIVWVLVFPAIPSSDGASYVELARRLLTTGNYEIAGTSAYWPPGYPFFLMPWLAIFKSTLAIVVCQCSLFVAGMLGIHRLGVLFGGDKAGRIASIFFALWPNVLALTGTPEKEMLVLALLPWVCYFILIPGYLVKFVAGILAGFCILVQPGIQFLLFGIVAIIFFIHGLRQAGFAVTFILAVCLVVFPWTIRNYEVFQQFVLVSTNGGDNLYRANNPLATGGYTPVGEIDLSLLDEVKKDKEAKKLAVKWIIDNPISFFGLTAEKQLRFMGDDSAGVYTTLKRGQATGSSSVYIAIKTFANIWWLLAWFLIAFLSTRQNSGNSLPRMIVWCWLYLFFLHSVFESAGKYHIPMLWVLCIWLGCNISHESHRK